MIRHEAARRSARRDLAEPGPEPPSVRWICEGSKPWERSKHEMNESRHAGASATRRAELRAVASMGPPRSAGGGWLGMGALGSGWPIWEGACLGLVAAR